MRTERTGMHEQVGNMHHDSYKIRTKKSGSVHPHSALTSSASSTIAMIVTMIRTASRGINIPDKSLA